MLHQGEQFLNQAGHQERALQSRTRGHLVMFLQMTQTQKRLRALEHQINLPAHPVEREHLCGRVRCRVERSEHGFARYGRSFVFLGRAEPSGNQLLDSLKVGRLYGRKFATRRQVMD